MKKKKSLLLTSLLIIGMIVAGLNYRIFINFADETTGTSGTTGTDETAGTLKTTDTTGVAGTTEIMKMISASETTETTEIETTETTKADETNGLTETTETMSANAARATTVDIPDAELKKLIKSALKITSDTITEEDMLNLGLTGSSATNFTITSKVKSLEGLQYATNLTIVTLNGVTLSAADYAILESSASISNMTFLSMNDLDTSFLAGMSALKDLTFESMTLDTEPLKQLTNLSYLYLYDIKNMNDDFITSLTNLSYFGMENMRPTDLRFLSENSKIKTIVLYNCGLTDAILDTLPELASVATIEVSQNNLYSVDKFLNYPNLTQLVLYKNHYYDLSKLADLTAAGLYVPTKSQTYTAPTAYVRNDEITVPNLVVNAKGNAIEPATISDNGVYDPETNTITWSNITANNGNFTYTWSADTSPQATGKIFTGTITQPYSTDIPDGSVTVDYVDEESNPLSEAETLTGEVGTGYVTEAKTFEGWTLKEIPVNATGIYAETPITVTYVYLENALPDSDSSSSSESSGDSSNPTPSNEPSNSSSSSDSSTNGKPNNSSTSMGSSDTGTPLPNRSLESHSKKNLPKTGEQDLSFMSVIGIVLLAVAGLFFSKRKGHVK